MATDTISTILWPLAGVSAVALTWWLTQDQARRAWLPFSMSLILMIFVFIMSIDLNSCGQNVIITLINLYVGITAFLLGTTLVGALTSGDKGGGLSSIVLIKRLTLLISIVMLILSIILLVVTSENPDDGKCVRSSTTSSLLVMGLVISVVLIGISTYSMVKNTARFGSLTISLSNNNTPVNPQVQTLTPTPTPNTVSSV